MARLTRTTLIAVVSVLALVAVAAVTFPALLNADSFRTGIESAVSKSLAARSRIGKLNLALWSGGLMAKDASVADDPAFSAQPFIEADGVKIRVEVLPLILHHQVHILGFSLESPKIQLVTCRERGLELFEHWRCGEQAKLSGR